MASGETPTLIIGKAWAVAGIGGDLRYAWTAALSPVIGLVAGLCLESLHAFAQMPDPNAMNTPAAVAHPYGNPDKKAPHFDILEYVVDGNTVLPTPDVEEAVYPFLGERKTAGDVDQAREALEEAYRKHGFDIVQVVIPQQGVEGGTIHLQVIENPVGRLRVVNSKYHSLEQIKDNAPSMAEGTVLNRKALQDDIVALNQQPDLKVTPAPKPGQRPGTTDVDLQVEDHLPLHGSLEINNQNNQDTTPLRLVGTISYDNLWQLGHSLSLSYQIAPENPNDAEVLSGTYLFALPRTPVSFLLYGVKSDSDVAALAGTDVVGKGSIVGARTIINLPGADDFYHSITAGIDRKDLLQNVVTGGLESKAPVLYYPITLAYSATLQNQDTVTQANASLNFAMPGWSSGSTDFDAQRFDALRQYFYFKASLSRTQPLLLGMVLVGKFDGQITPDPLLSSEQFSMGGENSVRGYLEAERLGDYGAHTTVELRSPSFGQSISSAINDWRVLAFFDAAALQLQNPLQGEQDSMHMASIGAGMRFTAFNIINAALDIGIPLVDGVVTKSGEPRVHFLVSSAF